MRQTLYCLAALCLHCAVAQARETVSQANKVQSRLLFEEARQRMAESRYETACALFERSLQLHAGIGTAYNLAQCLEKTGQTASAWKLYRSVARQSAARNQRERESVARQQATRLEPKLNHLVVRVDHPLPKLAITIEGQPLAPDDWGQPMALDPNTYRIEATAPGYGPWSGVAEIEAERESITLDIPHLQPLTPSTALELAPDPAPLDSSAKWYRAPAIWLGAGAAGLVGAGLFLHSANVSTGRQQRLCADPESACPPGEVAEHNHWAGQARGALAKSYVLAGLGALGLGAGFWLWQSDHSQPTDTADAPPRASVAIEGLAVRANLRF